MIRAVIEGTGSCLPEYKLTNDKLEKLVETSNEEAAQERAAEIAFQPSLEKEKAVA